MPSNKKALIRYKFLDRLLSDRHHCYDRKTLWEKVNEELAFAGFKTVTKRCIETDIDDLQDAPFNAPIEEYAWNGKTCLRYKRGFTIFKEELTCEERNLLREVLSTIGQFNGLDHFGWLDKLKEDLGVKNKRQIISFSNNPDLKNSNLLGTLFDHISNEVVVRLSYHTFADATIRTIDFHPYLLKQYNDRWFLIGAADSNQKILTFPLDRIDTMEPLKAKYIKCPNDLIERFKNIVGVTYYEDRPLEHILFWVSDASKDYVITKPIHESQTQYHSEKELQLRNNYPSLDGGAFFSIDCIPNYELLRLLTSFGKNLLVLSPENMKNEIFKHICDMNDKYSQLRTMTSR